MIISHRGNGTGHLANTLPAFEAALKAGADGFECDVRLTADKRIVALHDGNISVGRQRVSIARSTLAQIDRAITPQREPLLTLEELLDYISQMHVPVFIEVKDLSKALVQGLVDAVGSAGLWSLVHLIGFPVLINNALRAQREYPLLQVLRIGLFPFASLIAMASNGSGSVVGWQDSIPGSERLFRMTLSTARLARLRQRYDQRGMRLLAGVINRREGFEHFTRAGVTDFVTDDVEAAVTFMTLRGTSAQ